MRHGDDRRKTGTGRPAPRAGGSAWFGIRQPELPMPQARQVTGQCVHDVMQQPARTVAADASLTDVAALMREEDTGCLVVLRDGKAVGVVTDRDIVIRHLASGAAPRGARVTDVMTQPVVACQDTRTVADAAALMGDKQIRQLAVHDTDGRLIGMLSLDRIAEECSERLAGETLGEVVERR